MVLRLYFKNIFNFFYMGKSPAKVITVYGASSRRIDCRFIDAARHLGELIGRSGYTLVCGGGHTGVMGAAIDGVLSEGGEAVGILPAFMVERKWQHPGLTRMVSTSTMHERKSRMVEDACSIVACPGGVGTIEELMEIITWRKLGLWDGHIVILNVDGYYDPLLQMLHKGIEYDFMRSDDAGLWHVAATPEEAVDYILHTLK